MKITREKRKKNQRAVLEIFQIGSFSNFMHGLKSAILAFFQKSADWLDWPCPVSAALHFRSEDFFKIFLNMEPLSEEAPRILVIQI